MECDILLIFEGKNAKSSALRAGKGKYLVIFQKFSALRAGRGENTLYSTLRPCSAPAPTELRPLRENFDPTALIRK